MTVCICDGSLRRFFARCTLLSLLFKIFFYNSLSFVFSISFIIFLLICLFSLPHRLFLYLFCLFLSQCHFFFYLALTYFSHFVYFSLFSCLFPHLDSFFPPLFLTLTLFFIPFSSPCLFFLSLFSVFFFLSIFNYLSFSFTLSFSLLDITITDSQTWYWKIISPTFIKPFMLICTNIFTNTSIHPLHSD